MNLNDSRASRSLVVSLETEAAFSIRTDQGVQNQLRNRVQLRHNQLRPSETLRLISHLPYEAVGAHIFDLVPVPPVRDHATFGFDHSPPRIFEGPSP